jgi:hypothetical protein
VLRSDIIRTNFKKMKQLIAILSVLIFTDSFSQDSETDFDPQKWNPPYSLAMPKGWDVERFLIPIAFAPDIQYMGVEDVRFAPGWGNAKSNEYWTYAFLWYLDGKPEMNSKTIELNLKAYYTGLIGSNIERRKIPADKITPVKVSVDEVKTENGDMKTFGGKIEMLDYMEQKPMTLNCIVHLKSCVGQNHTFIFYQISPKPFSDNVWKNLQQIWLEFDCKK